MGEPVDKLEGVRGNKALCPAYDDNQPRLSFAETEDGTILLRCFRGCDVADICSALGVRVSDLFQPTDDVVCRLRLSVKFTMYDLRDGPAYRAAAPWLRNES